MGAVQDARLARMGNHAGLHPKERPHIGHDRTHHSLLIVAGLLIFSKFLRPLAARLRALRRGPARS
jgi:hypothetical protein